MHIFGRLLAGAPDIPDHFVTSWNGIALLSERPISRSRARQFRIRYRGYTLQGKEFARGC